MSKRGKSTRKKKNTALETSTPDQEREAGYHTMSNYLRVTEAKKILSGELLPSSFKFREAEIEAIENKIKEFLGKEKTNAPKIVMITGSPGAGKTLCTNFVLKRSAYKVIALNSNLVKKKKDVQRILAEELLEGEDLGEEKELTTFKIISCLEKRKNAPSCILYIEEVELFFNSAKEYLSEDFFSLFANRNLKIMLIGISNTIDALEKHGPKMNVRPEDVTNIVFNPYSVDEIKSILEDKLDAVLRKTGIKLNMNEKLVKYVVNKINEMKKGDLRMLFEFLRAVSRLLFPKLEELGDSFEEEVDITIGIVQAGFQEVEVQKSRLINKIPFQQQAILIAFYCYISQLDMIYLTEDELKQKTKAIYQKIQLDLRRDISQELAELEMYGFIENRESKKKTDTIVKRYILKVSLDDIRYTFEGHPILGRFFLEE